MSAILGGSGILAWLFRFFDGRADRALSLIGKQSTELDRLVARVKILEERDTFKTTRIDKLERDLDIMEEWVDILIRQLKTAGIDPAPKPGDEPPDLPPPSRSRGFRP